MRPLARQLDDGHAHGALPDPGQPLGTPDGISLVPLLKGYPSDQPKHRYLYWENGTKSPHAQAARQGDWYGYREHPSKPLKLYNLADDVGCTTDLAGKHPDVVRQVLDVFEEARVDSEWYTNPGDSREVIQARRQRAESEGTLQNSTRANSRYTRD